METQGCRCCDRNWGWQHQQRWIKGKTSNSLAMLPKCLPMSAIERRMMHLFGEARFDGASHGKPFWACIPPRVSVYLHNPQVTLHRPAQTALSEAWRRVHPRRRWTPEEQSRAEGPLMLEGIFSLWWSSQVSSSCFVTTGDYMFGWIVSVHRWRLSVYLSHSLSESVCINKLWLQVQRDIIPQLPNRSRLFHADRWVCACIGRLVSTVSFSIWCTNIGSFTGTVCGYQACTCRCTMQML